ncbi:antibiotic biosynthesis monooxygenase [Streptomyces sp. TRM66268-LWL]|uniref:Antibiotic biosynthesis monooxygenase n=1 Tax=Streptomyces polyasparticus TaxID=2767826 RepID=A0ABR7SV42_9ACTN|nr:antibiotic biosynthesis monooxygenase [Streptomyces polyasparticus]MBC9718802.1 antibiotic biosynthesis monooxygenase [Streptomyces polyasparticus]
MIVRIWRGWTTPENADAYESVVSTQVLPAIAARKLSGYHGAYLLRRPLAEGEVEFSTVMFFDSLDAVRQFVGEDYEVAHVPAEAQAVLARFDARSAHYETLLTPEDTRPE